MRDYRTNVRSGNVHPDIVVAVDPELDVGTQWLLDFFESEIRRGVVFRSGQTVQIGWMVSMLKANHDGDLEVWEPGFDSMPINWVRGVNKTLQHLLLQREICAQLGVEPDFPSLRQSGVVSANYGADGNFVMARQESCGNDSGWVLAAREDANVEGKRCSLFEVALRDLRVIPFLGLPAGSHVRYSSAGIRVDRERTTVSSDSNEFLRKLHTSRA
ncbi:immunity protein Imm33 domain-containing protein [Trinickia acidisoli]|uniref:immunity protein Imm33 domain-containing protein n=1 Tax=Trinickia acidisoli TaxID=2767482 RepID=UPI001A8E6871|nr:hypothetical protein [Trinickia acidisoli]